MRGRVPAAAAAALLLLPFCALGLQLPGALQQWAGALRPPAAAERSRELQETLRTLYWAKEAPSDASLRRVDELVEALANERVPLSGLGEGLWLAVLSTGGDVPLWQRRLNLLGGSRFGQRYRDGERSVVNYGEILGPAACVKAFGSYAADDDTRNCPKDFTVTVSRGELRLGPASLPLPIAGTGALRVLYADSGLRIFQTPRDTDGGWELAGLVVCQMPLEALGVDAASVDAELVR